MSKWGTGLPFQAQVEAVNTKKTFICVTAQRKNSKKLSNYSNMDSSSYKAANKVPLTTKIKSHLYLSV